MFARLKTTCYLLVFMQFMMHFKNTLNEMCLPYRGVPGFDFWFLLPAKAEPVGNSGHLRNRVPATHRGWPGLHCWPLALARLCRDFRGIWGMNQRMEALCLCLFLCLSLYVSKQAKQVNNSSKAQKRIKGKK